MKNNNGQHLKRAKPVVFLIITMMIFSLLTRTFLEPKPDADVISGCLSPRIAIGELAVSINNMQAVKGSAGMLDSSPALLKEYEKNIQRALDFIASEAEWDHIGKSKDFEEAVQNIQSWFDGVTSQSAYRAELMLYQLLGEDVAKGLETLLTDTRENEFRKGGYIVKDEKKQDYYVGEGAFKDYIFMKKALFGCGTRAFLGYHLLTHLFPERINDMRIIENDQEGINHIALAVKVISHSGDPARFRIIDMKTSLHNIAHHLKIDPQLMDTGAFSKEMLLANGYRTYEGEDAVTFMLAYIFNNVAAIFAKSKLPDEEKSLSHHNVAHEYLLRAAAIAPAYRTAGRNLERLLDEERGNILPEKLLKSAISKPLPPQKVEDSISLHSSI